MPLHRAPDVAPTNPLDSVARDRSTFDPVPSRRSSLRVSVARSAPSSAQAVGVAVAAKGPVPRTLGIDRAGLAAAGFEAKVGQVYVVPRKDGHVVAVGVGDGSLSLAETRDAAAAFGRAASKQAVLATALQDASAAPIAEAAQAVVEGIALARYRYSALKSSPSTAALTDVVLVASGPAAAAVERGAVRGAATAAAAGLARDLANTPPSHLTARRLADLALEIGAEAGLAVEVLGVDELRELGCGGLLGVNAGSVEPPRLVKLGYRPKRASRKAPARKLALVGKGIMYDSGGISLKPTDGMHAMMKMDMSGAAAVLATMSALAALGCQNEVTGYLMCTDNMPSGSAMKLGDVLHLRGGTTVEVHNTDAEGRLVLADGLALANEEQPDAIVDIATLTGSALGALGTSIAAILGNDQDVVDGLRQAGERSGETVWQLPLASAQYRKLLDSDVADIKNVAGPYAGAITAAIFLSTFVGDTPWAHLDIAGTMKVDSDESWRSKGATGFGTRLLLDWATAPG